ncbi:hypothetical protein NHX12_023496 [Muraenolepis orangiensis]|uniref:Uncharacterized protein n=1 Tax=Muraenolepis orangiensis TaxID=630683 RepID=A0A9Q0ISU6_9TELE|nr:hypothetical protein NHX12_023496 [Muraenolepis orangiensis]
MGNSIRKKKAKTGTGWPASNPNRPRRRSFWWLGRSEKLKTVWQEQEAGCHKGPVCLLHNGVQSTGFLYLAPN